MKTVVSILALFALIIVLLLSCMDWADAQQPQPNAEQRALGQQVMNQVGEIVGLRSQLLTAQDDLAACKASAKPAEPDKK